MASVTAESVPALMLARVAASPDRLAFRFPAEGGWKDLTWKQVLDRVRDIASGLRALGLNNEERVAILASTRIEWILADFGILCAFGATTTVYPGNTSEECAFILNDSNTVLVLAENDAQVQKLQQERSQLTKVKNVIVFDGAASADGWVLTLSDLEEKGRAYQRQHPGAFEQVISQVKRESLATLIYTSGTTGRPKGVELTNDAWLYEAEAIDGLNLLKEDDLQYLWLPLAHVFGKVLEVAQIRLGFSTAVDGRVDKLTENLALIKPTWVAAVPRIFEKVYNRVVQSAREGGGVKYAIFKWALAVGKKEVALRQKGKRMGPLLALEHAVATRLVYRTLQNRFGGRLRYFVSGSAPLNPDLGEFFAAMGIIVLEGYGLTESSAASLINLPNNFRFGTVGRPLPGVEIKIVPSDGEVLLRGRGIMRGYHGQPEATREALDADGWFHTGDIGTLEDGFLRITDRKKDLIKTSGGKYVAPQAVESKFKVLCPYANQVLVHGNNRNFCVMLVALDEEALSKWATAQGMGKVSYKQLAEDPKVRELFQSAINELNKGLPNHESIRKFALLPEDLTVESGDLTPSLKLKRKAVEQKYRALLESFYSGAVNNL